MTMLKLIKLVKQDNEIFIVINDTSVINDLIVEVLSFDGTLKTIYVLIVVIYDGISGISLDEKLVF